MNARVGAIRWCWRRVGLAGAVCVAVLLGVSAAAGGAGVQRVADAAQDTARAIHLLSRATWGVRPADVRLVLESGPAAWLEAQLHPERLRDDALVQPLARFPLATMDVGTLIREYSPMPAPNVTPGDTAGARQAREAMTPAQRLERAQRNPQRILGDLVGAKLVRAVWSERQLESVMTDFWFNHFNVYFAKGLDRYLVGDYEASAIRPHVFGRFEDMLIATAQHPAMLFYLDNFTSVAPDSVMGRAGTVAERRREAMMRRLGSLSDEEKERLVRNGRVTRAQLERLEQAAGQPRRERGMNENYARELLELHTLGVDGGYTQDDVVNVARAFTGWTIDGLARGAPTRNAMREEAASPRFVFRPMAHDPGEKVILGATLPAGRGIEDGLEVLRTVARHPSTARHIAKKLVERFVSDAGDAALEAELAQVFLRSGGDLREVTRALFTSERFHAVEHRRAKVKTPFELVASALRVTHATVLPGRRVMESLRGMGQLPYTESAPTGFPSAAEEWVSTSALLNRMNFALDLAAGRVQGVRIDAMKLVGEGEGGVVARLIGQIMPGIDAAPIVARLQEDLTAQPDLDRRAAGSRVLGLVLGSPEFQRR